jgi:hypothetical protein
VQFYFQRLSTRKFVQFYYKGHHGLYPQVGILLNSTTEIELCRSIGSGLDIPWMMHLHFLSALRFDLCCNMDCSQLFLHVCMRSNISVKIQYIISFVSSLISNTKICAPLLTPSTLKQGVFSKFTTWVHIIV